MSRLTFHWLKALEPMPLMRRSSLLHGLPCPSLRSPSEHYFTTFNQDFDFVVQDLEQGTPEVISKEAIDILVESCVSSEISEGVRLQVSKINGQSERIWERRGGQASFITQSLILTRRSFVDKYHNWGYYWLSFAIYIALCLCVGTIFRDVGLTYGSIQARGSMLMFVAAFLNFMAIGRFPPFVEYMKIFGWERLNGHYGIGDFFIGNSLSSILYLFIISVIPGAIAYYIVGLQRSFKNFAYFVLLLFVCMMLVERLMMIVATIVLDFLMGIITGARIQGVIMLKGGFFRLPNDLPKPF